MGPNGQDNRSVRDPQVFGDLGHLLHTLKDVGDLRNILSNCTDLVRERENRPRTCHPQRTSEPAAALAFNILISSGNTALFTVLETSLQTVQEEGSKSHLWVSQNLITLASSRSFASSTAASLAEPLLDLECPLDLDLAWLALLLQECVLDRDRKHSLEEELSSLN